MRNIAEREGRSISDVAHGLIRIGLEALASDEEAQARRRVAKLENLGEIRGAALETHRMYEGNLVAEALRARVDT
jgi:hypothetical protein